LINDTQDLEPIPHFKVTDYVRIPIQKKGEEYIVYMSNNYRKRYILKSLPSYIVSKIVIANVLANNIIDDISLTRAALFCSQPLNGEEDTAWRASENWYIVVLHINDYYDLQGDTIDTRKESKD
tara:strand:- start:96 stop:467 length:372 start_codon:yes stop_codon:yes gene_type:complete